MQIEKRRFLNKVGLFLRTREKILNNFQSKIFSDNTATPFPKTLQIGFIKKTINLKMRK